MPTLSELLVANTRLKTELDRARAELAVAVAEPATAEAEVLLLQEQLRQAQGEVKWERERANDIRVEARNSVREAKAELAAAESMRFAMEEKVLRLEATHTTPRLKLWDIGVSAAIGGGAAGLALTIVGMLT